MFTPKLFLIKKEFTKKSILDDVIAGILVGIVALPLAIAFGIASGVSPEKGILTAIIGGFTVSFLGGSRVQIGGPTGAFIVIVYGIVQEFGIEGLLLATFMAGIILVLMGIAKFGSLIKFIPYPVVVGFTSGIAVVIFSSQIKDLLGLNITSVPAEFFEKWTVIFGNLKSINWTTVFISALSLFIIYTWPKISRKIPGSIIAILICTLAVKFLSLEVATIESVFGEISSTIPSPAFPSINLALIKKLLLPATVIAILASIEALLSAVVADGMIGGKHKSNTELIAQGVANILSPLFGGIPVTGAIARTATNIKNGGRSPIAGIVHAIVLLMILLILGQWAKMIPMATLAAILVVVSINMSEYNVFRQLLKSPRSDVIVLLTTFGLTVIFDLTIAIEIGIVLAAILFMKRMTNVSNINLFKGEFIDPSEDRHPAEIEPREIPDNVEIYEINGPFFFGAAAKFKEAMQSVENPPKIRILRMRHVMAIDATGLNLLREFIKDSKRDNTIVILSGVHTQPLDAFTKYGLKNEIGEENILGNIDDALKRSKIILGLPF